MHLEAEYLADPNHKPKDFISYLESEWQAKNSDSLILILMNLYISILYEPDKEGAAVVQYLLTKMRQKLIKLFGKGYVENAMIAYKR